MKKRITLLLIVVVLIVCLLPSIAFATGSYNYSGSCISYFDSTTYTGTNAADANSYARAGSISGPGTYYQSDIWKNGSSYNSLRQYSGSYHGGCYLGSGSSSFCRFHDLDATRLYVAGTWTVY